MASSMLLMMVLACTTAVSLAVELPSCESDVAEHCLYEEADMSAEGIQGCLERLAESERSSPCNAYLTLLAACTQDIGLDGICAGDHAEGDTMPCLLQRTKPEQLSESCKAALPVEEVLSGLAHTFWKGGKRYLEDEELEQLDEEDTETYERWVKRKSKGKNSAQGRDRAYAINKMKQQKLREKVGKDIAATLSADVEKAFGEGISKKEVKKLVKKKVSKATKAATKNDAELGSFDKDEIATIINRAMKQKEEL